MVEMKDNELIFHFPEVHEAAEFRVSFQRTLRLPDDNRRYPLPPGLGRFPLQHVEDHVDRLPAVWGSHGGALLPMHQAEAMWVRFSSKSYRSVQYPFAVKIAAGKINVLTGELWSNELDRNPQDYVVVPEQPWIDGFCVSKGLIRQFVAMPLGAGYTAEEQLTGEGHHGGLQIIAYPMKREFFERLVALEVDENVVGVCCAPSDPGDGGMGLAPGGLMSQQIFKDPHGFEVWDTSRSSRCFVHILNSTQWLAATDTPVPNPAPTAKTYTDAGLPWFDYYNEEATALDAHAKLSNLDGVAAKAYKLGDAPVTDNDSIATPKVVTLSVSSHNGVADGSW